MAKTGRPKIPINWRTVEQMASIHCTFEEISFVTNCSIDTLERACKRENGVTFAVFCEQKRSTGKMSLRRAMWKKAVEGTDNTMMIWLSKQHLGMTDKQENINIEKAPIEIKFGWGDESNSAATDSTSEEDSGIKGKIQKG